eukprot:6106967-Pyramimonas_sp.AAC.1
MRALLFPRCPLLRPLRLPWLLPFRPLRQSLKVGVLTTPLIEPVSSGLRQPTPSPFDRDNDPAGEE